MRVLVTGPTGQLGHELVRVAEKAGHLVGRLGRHEPVPCDLADGATVAEAVRGFAPDLVLHAAARTDVDGCERDPDRAYAVNATGTRHLAEAAEQAGAHLAYVSTDFVFDGTTGAPYTEADPTGPVSVYGASKRAGEDAAGPAATVVRTAWLWSAHGSNLVRTVLRLAEADGAPLRFVADQIGSPTSATDLAPVVLALATHRVAGVVHVVNAGGCSRADLARAVLDAAGHDPDRVHDIDAADLDPPQVARRPTDSRLASLRLADLGIAALRDHREALAEVVADLRRR